MLIQNQAHKINFSGNCLPAEEGMDLHAAAFLNLRHLTMGRMKYGWIDVTKCLRAFPFIQNLMLPCNVIETISHIDQNSNIMKLTEISLENNLISSWDEILKLGSIPWLVQNYKLISNLFFIIT